jgi:hypothetical protein
LKRGPVLIEFIMRRVYRDKFRVPKPLLRLVRNMRPNVSGSTGGALRVGVGGAVG